MSYRIRVARLPQVLPAIFAAAIVSLGAPGSAGASTTRPAYPDWCQQSNPASSTACEFASALPAQYLVPNMTGDSRCPWIEMPPSIPPYGNRKFSSEDAAIAYTKSNWDCYLSVVLGACRSGGAAGDGPWWFPGTNTYVNDPSDLKDRDWGDLQRYARRPHWTEVSGQCISESATSNYVHRYRPLACQPGYTLSMVSLSDGQTWPICQRTASSCESKGKNGFCPMQGNPIDITAGSKHATETDFRGSGTGALELVRRYSSSIVPETDARRFTSLGLAWRTNFDRVLVTYPGPAGKTGVRIHRPDGSSLFYLVDAAGAVTRSPANQNQLVPEASGWKLRLADEQVESYDFDGNLLSIVDRHGAATTLAYDTLGRLATVTDPQGRSLAFTYNAQDWIASVALPDGGTVSYEYDSLGRLTQVTHADGRTRQYLYAEAAQGASEHFWALTGVIDEFGRRLATYTYSKFSSGVLSAQATEHAGGAGRVSITDPRASSVTATDANGTSRVYSKQTVAGESRIYKVDEPCGSGCTATTTLAFDAFGNVTSRTDANGRVTTRVFDTSRGLETKVTHENNGTPICPTGTTRYSSNYGSACTVGVCMSPTAFPGSQSATPIGWSGWQYSCALPAGSARSTWTEWHASFRLPARIAEPRRLTTNAYDATGATCGAAGALCSRTVQATTDATGASGFAATVTGNPRSWSYTYDALGRVLTVNGPRTDVADVTTYAYHAANDPAGNYRAGDLASVTNALGQVTSFTHYDGAGRLLRVVDANGLATELAYWPRGWLRSRRIVKAGGVDETTLYDYDLAGNLAKVTQPDGSWLAYAYDDAHRLAGVADNLGNSIAYVLDGLGNRKEEKVYDPGGTLRQLRKREFDSLNRLWKDIGAANQTTTYAYDKVGNLLTATQPASLARPATTNLYDPFNRLIQSVDPENGAVRYEYDALDQLAKVIDPRSLATTYTVDGLGNPSALASPDTGTTTNTLFDEAGNLRQSTDARGKTVVYTYDALNRVTGATWPDQAVTYAYDQGANGIGRLTSIADATGQTSYTYDAAGRVLTDSRVTGGLTFTTGYAYDASGRLYRITYPSGRQVTYTFDAAGRISGASVTAGTTSQLASNIAYHPFGGLTGFTFGSGGLAYTRTVDQDGRIASYTLGATTFNLTFDDAGNITRLSDPANPALDRVFAYDKADRLLSLATSPTTLNQSYTYDKLGNRLTRVVNGVSTAYTLASTSNRLASVGGIARSYDFSGNQTGNGASTFTYDDRGRLTGAMTPLGAVSYAVNALGQRVRKTVGTASTFFAYDLQGRLLGEYDGTGLPIQELSWLGDTPVATIRPNGTGFDIFPIWTDHLNTPRMVTDMAGQVRWEWPNTDPFGANLPNENPAGLGAFAFNLRFPGQYFDTETATHYNYFRDYDPGIGRYVQSDPIGLDGGLNTYGYSVSNPLTYRDPTGLDITIHFFKPFPGHIGIGIGSNDSVGLFPIRRRNYLDRLLINPCPDAPGVVARDKILENGSKSETLVIKTEKWQDDLIQRELDRQRERAQTYNVCTQQCSGFVVDMLRVGGIAVPDNPPIYPKTLFEQLRSIHGAR